MKLFLLILITCFATALQAQDLTGIWRGSFRSQGNPAADRLMELMGADDRYKFEVQINQKGKAFEGVTYSYKTTVFYGKATCKGTVNPATRKVMLEELKIVEVRMTGMSDACIMTLFLQYSKTGDEEFLEGTYISMNVNDSTNCGKGTVFLRKVATSDFYEEPFLAERRKQQQQKLKLAEKKTETVNAPSPDQASTAKPNKPATPPAKPKTLTSVGKAKTTPEPTGDTAAKIKPTTVDTIKRMPERPPVAVVIPKVLESRENELVKTIVTSSPEIIVNIYDNGTIDNDTISVYLNKKLVLHKQKLTEKPLTIKINLEEGGDYQELVMVAENLGEIPPNTSLMVVKAGNKQYEVRITSTEQKNAVVVFKYQPESRN
jgi:hypothetical protein